MAVPKFSEGHRLPWTEIFAAGTHRGKTYSPRDLDDIVSNFNRFSTGDRPQLKVPGVVGHEEDLEKTNHPAGGWGEKIRHVVRGCDGCSGRGSVSGQRCPLCEGKGRRHVLEKRFRDLDPKFADDLRAKRYDTVSAEIYDDAKDAGLPGKGKVLRRVAFLGGEIPQNKGLRSPPEPESHSERYGGLVFSRAVKSPGGSWVCFSEVRHMPLQQGKSREVIGKNISEMEKTGDPKEQAVAAALRTADVPKEHAEGDMGRDAMIEELTKKGISAEALKDCSDDALAEWCRSLESAEGGAAEDERGNEETADEVAEEMPPEEHPRDEDFDEESLAAETPAKRDEPEDDEPKVYAEDGDPVEDDPEKMSARLRKMMSKCRSFAARCGMSEEDAAKAYSETGEDPARAKKAEQEYTMGTVKMSESARILRREREELARERAALKADMAEYRKFSEETLTTERKRSVAGILDRLCEQGKVMPALKDHYADMLENADAREPVKFSEGGKTVKMTRFEKIVRDLERSPSRFREVTRGGRAVATDADAEGEKVAAHWESFSEVFEATDTSKESFTDGFKNARKLNPKLTAEEYLKAGRAAG